ncbi:Asd/ArgC dimerization domain-containing protein [Terriglobus tenax]|uniref:Asd/ArgC dimerization domain-containing protein n=1 Tax=Terriglobus tenax TaxID=1111115 RepID=UPI0021DF8BDE|nr:Asd/ArgC dimerization domain-containing protein [Terriglobus tenax]
MEERVYHAGIAGVTSLAGKDLHEELGQSVMAAADVRLLDHEELAGQLEATDDEMSFIQKIDAHAFEGLDVVFFAGSAAQTAESWNFARKAGANIVDLSYALESEPETLVQAPWVEQALAAKGTGTLPGLSTVAVVAAHPASLMLALIAARAGKSLPLKSLAAVVYEPASQLGKETMDELHQQTLNLLSFQNLPKEQYDAQAAFNLLPEFGESALQRLSVTENRIRKHFDLLAAGRLPEVALQVVHAPVFHGYTASVLVEFAEPVDLPLLERALEGEHVEVLLGDAEPPSNVSAAGRKEILVRLPEDAGQAVSRVWLWLAADNLKLAAQNAIACAVELEKLRPQGKVQ